jgi:hypothetical protein
MLWSTQSTPIFALDLLRTKNGAWQNLTNKQWLNDGVLETDAVVLAISILIPVISSTTGFYIHPEMIYCCVVILYKLGRATAFANWLQHQIQ